MARPLKLTAINAPAQVLEGMDAQASHRMQRSAEELPLIAGSAVRCHWQASQSSPVTCQPTGIRVGACADAALEGGGQLPARDVHGSLSDM